MVRGQKTQTVLSDLCVYVSQDCTGKPPKLHKGLLRFEITSLDGFSIWVDIIFCILGTANHFVYNTTYNDRAVMWYMYQYCYIYMCVQTQNERKMLLFSLQTGHIWALLYATKGRYKVHQLHRVGARIQSGCFLHGLEAGCRDPYSS